MNDFKNYKLNLKPDKIELDRDYKLNIINVNYLPKKAFIPINIINDQGRYGSCTAFSLSKILEYFSREEYKQELDVSKFFLYYNSRVADRTVFEDNGTSLKTALKTYNRNGACINELHPYIDENFSKKPSDLAYFDGKKRYKVRYEKVSNLNEALYALASGHPLYAGIKIYDSFYETGKDGLIPINSGKMNGLHAVVFNGYENLNNMLFNIKTKREIYGINSWSENWGSKGCFKFNADMWDDLVVDCWCLIPTDVLVGDTID